MEALETELKELIIETLMLEEAFNRDAGFGEKDDELPDFFYDEALAPTKKRARHHAAKVRQFRTAWLDKAGADMAINPLPANAVY